MVTIDEASKRAACLWDEIRPNLAEIETEQDARFAVVNRLLTEVLGWDFTDVKTEPHADGGYADYLLHSHAERVMVIEAKRIGRILLDTVAPEMKSYLVSGPAMKSAQEGIDQAAKYALSHGANFAAITTGLVWIAFLPFPGNGQSYHDTKALVFPNFEAILNNFAVFFELFSKEAVTKKLYKLQLAKAGGLLTQSFDPLLSAVRSNDRMLLPKSRMALDLEPVFREFFGAISGETDKDLLLECFVETRESALADASFEKIVRDLAANIETIASSQGDELAEQIKFAVDTGHGETVVLVGNKGSGKSTFLERFFDLILSPSLREKCLVVRLDLLQCPGDIATLADWITLKIKKSLEDQLFNEGNPSYDELQGLYYSDYQRWRTGQFKVLYDTDKTQFKIRFGEYLHEQIDNNAYGYVLKLINNAIRSRKLLPCVTFDNADHFSEAFQQEVFQYSQALHSEMKFTFMVVPITDRSVWKLSKEGALQTYGAKYFYLPVPSTKDVLDKRLTFLQRKAEEGKDSRQYFVGKGIRLTVENIRTFAACVEEVLIQEDYVARRISWLANNEIRRSLQLCQLIILSPHLSIDDLLTAFASSRAKLISVSYPKFMRALVLVDYDIYSLEDNSFVSNVFGLSQEFVSTPLLQLSLLKLLIDKAGSEGGVASYLTLPNIRSYFEAMGIPPEVSDEAVRALLEFRLVEPYDTSDDEVHSSQRVAIAHSGRMHFEMATTDLTYIAEVCLVTPIRVGSVVDNLRSLAKRKTDDVGAKEIAKVFYKYCLEEDKVFAHLPADAFYNGQRQMRSELQRRWVDRDEAVSKEKPNSQASGLSHVKARVIWYDKQKGYGFVNCGLEADALIGNRTLQAAQIDGIKPDDVLICDVVAGTAGRNQVIQVYSFESPAQKTADIKFVEGEVVHFNVDKHYAFAVVSGMEDDVYISSKAMSEADVDALFPGTKVRMIIEPGRFGRSTCAVLEVLEEIDPH